MALALDEARAAARDGEVPVGAIVYETATGVELARGANSRERARDPSGHAEHAAILGACAAIGDWRLNHCSLAVTLEPCPMCAGLIVNARIGRLVFGARDPKAGAVRSLYTICDDERLNHRCAVVEGVLADACAGVLSAFFKDLRTRAE